MIKKLIIKWIFGSIFKSIKKKKEWKKIDKYVNKPNGLDKQLKQVQRNVSKYGKSIENVEKGIAILNKDSHPPIFGRKDLRKITKRLEKLEKEKVK